MAALTGIVDWSGAARGPRGYDLGWCRLDLVLLIDERIADIFLAAYDAGRRIGWALGDVLLWDAWAVARSHDMVETWVANYAPLGRGDLDEGELRRRHSLWATRLCRNRRTDDPSRPPPTPVGTGGEAPRRPREPPPGH